MPQTPVDDAGPKRTTVLLFAVLVVGVCLLLAECGTRVVFALQVGPEILLYGLVSDREERNVHIHENIVAGSYSKYFPNQKRTDKDETGESFDVTINEHGFRGRDFTISKPPGLIRVVTLGASSTFGYHARDDDTYPRYIEELLSQECPHRRFEVINLGVPHLDSEQILALFLAEGLALEPDVVTFYEGVNDAAGGAWRAPTALSLRSRVMLEVRSRLLLARFLRSVLRRKQFSAAEVASHTEGKSERFLGNLDRISRAAGEQGALLVVGTQQARSTLLPGDQVLGISYAEEVELVREQLAREGEVAEGDVHFLTHAALMGDLRAWAAANDVPLVDVIDALDPSRETIVTWVHLNAAGNRIVARAFTRAILPRVCPPQQEQQESAAAPVPTS